jgi:cation diffusion facilitator CzcD-associated flavoprotein CzcO
MSISDEYDEEVPILIIGGGPSGLLLAYMLDQLGSQYFFVQQQNLTTNPAIIL